MTLSCFAPSLQDQARIVEAQGGATADDLLRALAQNLPQRCTAVRQLIQARVGAAGRIEQKVGRLASVQ